MLLTISKTFYIFFIFYVVWFQNLFNPINNMPLILGGGMIFFLLLNKLSSLEKSKINLPLPLNIWVIFSIYILLTGFFITDTIEHLFSSWFTYLQNLILIFYIVNVAKVEGSVDFFQKSFLYLTIIYWISMVTLGVELTGGRLALSTTSNPNGDGLVLLSGVFFILFYYDNSIKKAVLSIVLIVSYSYVIFLTGSRTTFVALVILLLLSTFAFQKENWKRLTIVKKIFLLIILLTLLVFLVFIFVPTIRESALYERLILEGDTGGDIVRMDMYQEARQFFERNPVFGIGFNQFEILSKYGVYSHSTYAEIISTTGIIGTLLYFFPYLIIIYKLFTIYLKFEHNNLSVQALNYLNLMLVLLVLGVVRIHFYGILDNFIFALMISFYVIVDGQSKSCNQNISYQKLIMEGN